MHTVKYLDSKLYKLQKLADSISYHIDSDVDNARALFWHGRYK